MAIQIASRSHDAVLSKAGYTLESTTETSDATRVRTVSRYTKSAGKKASMSVYVTIDSDSGEPTWEWSMWGEDVDYQQSTGSSSEALGEVLKNVGGKKQ